MKKIFYVLVFITVLWCGHLQFNRWKMESDWGYFVRDNVKVTAYSMNSEDERGQYPLDETSLLFHSNPIVSQKVISNPKDVQLIKEMVLSLDGNYHPVAMAACEPAFRHGMRFEKDGQKVEAIMCFFCGESEVFDAGGKSHRAYVNGKWLKTLNALYLRNKMRLPDYYENSRH